MAMSKAKKERMKMEKQGRMNPESLRGSWNGVNPVTKVRPNKKKKFMEKVAGL